MARLFLSLLLLVILSSPVVADEALPVRKSVTNHQQLWLSVQDNQTLICPAQWISTTFATEQVAACCKICRKGKACGNSCISRLKTCHKGQGCACDANQQRFDSDRITLSRWLVGAGTGSIKARVER